MVQISVVSEQIHQILGTEPGSYFGHQTITVPLNSPELDRMKLKVSTKWFSSVENYTHTMGYYGLLYRSEVIDNNKKL